MKAFVFCNKLDGDIFSALVIAENEERAWALLIGDESQIALAKPRYSVKELPLQEGVVVKICC